MQTVTLYGAEIGDQAALHAALARQLDLPDWYGANLDALHDLLTERRPTLRVLIFGREALREHLGEDYYLRFLRTLYDARVYVEER